MKKISDPEDCVRAICVAIVARAILDYVELRRWRVVDEQDHIRVANWPRRNNSYEPILKFYDPVKAAELVAWIKKEHYGLAHRIARSAIQKHGYITRKGDGNEESIS